MELAEKYGFIDYAQPAGGCCFLTDEKYSNKLVDLWKTRGTKEYELDDIMLLKVGRHIRPNPRFKIMIAREDGEGRFMEGYKKTFTNLNCSSHQGPLALIEGMPTEEDLVIAAKLIARYGQGREAQTVDVEIRLLNGESKNLSVTPFLADEIPQEWFI